MFRSISVIMVNKVADTIRELRAISYKMETMRTETRRYMEEKDREMQGMQDRINLLCSGLVEADAAVLGSNSTTGWLNLDIFFLFYNNILLPDGRKSKTKWKLSRFDLLVMG